MRLLVLMVDYCRRMRVKRKYLLETDINFNIVFVWKIQKSILGIMLGFLRKNGFLTFYRKLRCIGTTVRTFIFLLCVNYWAISRLMFLGKLCLLNPEM